jgi:chloride channel protein, CIC family
MEDPRNEEGEAQASGPAAPARQGPTAWGREAWEQVWRWPARLQALRANAPLRPIEDARAGLLFLRRLLLPKAAEDIPLLPSAEHTALVTLASLVGLYAGLAATLLRVLVRLGGALFFSPSAVLALVVDPASLERARLRASMAETPWHPELLSIGGIAVVALVVFGAWRHLEHRVRSTPRLARPSRAFLVAGLLFAAVLAHFALSFLLDVADALTPEHGGLLEVIDRTPWWAVCVVALVGGSLVGLVLDRFASVRGHGVPDVMVGVALHGGRIPPAMGPSYSGAAALTVASTGSVGLEGPVAVFGASTASGLGQALSLSPDRLRVLATAGAAAGIAASFNAPIGGALFALEIIAGDFALATFSPVVIASVVGAVVHRSMEGNDPVFGVVSFTLKSGWEIGAYVVLGLLCGIVGTLFVKVMEEMGHGTRRWLAPFPGWLRPGVGFLAIAAVAMAAGRPEVLGTGYDTMRALLDGKVILLTAGVILVGKMVATAVTLSSGGVGGIFFPSLFVGAATGGMFGGMAQAVFGERVAGPGSYALVGMGAVLTAVQQAPLTALVMVFELTNDYAVILPLMVSVILSTLLARRALGMNLYQRALRRRGIVLSRGQEQNLLRTLQVRDAMSTSFVAIPEATRLREVVALISTHPTTTFPLVDAEGLLCGALGLTDLRPVMLEKDLGDIVVAGELGTRDVVTIRPADTLGLALSRLALRPFEHLIVVDEANPRRVVGLISRQQVMATYQAALAREGVFAEAEEGAAVPPAATGA